MARMHGYEAEIRAAPSSQSSLEMMDYRRPYKRSKGQRLGVTGSVLYRAISHVSWRKAI